MAPVQGGRATGSGPRFERRSDSKATCSTALGTLPAQPARLPETPSQKTWPVRSVNHRRKTVRALKRSLSVLPRLVPMSASGLLVHPVCTFNMRSLVSQSWDTASRGQAAWTGGCGYPAPTPISWGQFLLRVDPTLQL